MTEQTHLDETAARLARRPWPARPLHPGVRVSFEFFPAADEAGAVKLDRCVAELAPLGPRFVSVTYGAGGTTRDRTQRAIERIRATHEVPVAGHLTCVGATRSEVEAVVDDYLAVGVEHIVALRGDAPLGETDGTVPDGFRSAADLVAGLRDQVAGTRHAGLTISVAAYPEVHPRATSAAADLDSLRAKIDAGADRAITQFFFDTDVFLRFLDRARRAGISVPIVPGIMPITSFAGIRRFADRCGADIPGWMVELFADLDEAPEVRGLVAATVAAEQCRRLAEHGVNEFHFYTMNRPELTAAVCRILGVRAPGAARAEVRAS